MWFSGASVAWKKTINQELNGIIPLPSETDPLGPTLGICATT